LPINTVLNDCLINNINVKKYSYLIRVFFLCLNLKNYQLKITAMTKQIIASLFSIALLSACKKEHKEENSQMKFTYPETIKGNVVDTYFDTKINDPYRWLEDDKSPETEAWVAEQNKVTYAHLDEIPYRKTLNDRLSKLWNYEKISAPFKEGNNDYYYKNDGLQNQSVLYKKNTDGEDEVFLDPNTFSKEGTTSLGNVSFSKDGKTVAYSISEGGSDWRKVIIMDADTKTVKEDTLIDVKFSGLSWKGNEGLYYSSYDKPKGSELSAKTDQHKLYFHKLGTPQKEDQLIFGGTEDQKRRYVGGYVTEDDAYLLISGAISTSGNDLFIQNLTQENAPLVHMVKGFDADAYVIENDANKLFVVTNLNAPNQKIITVNAQNPTTENWVDFIPETENVLSPSTGAGYFFAEYMKDAVSQIKQYDYTGKLIREVELPGVGSVGGFNGKKEAKDLYYSFTNYITPNTIYKFDPKAGNTDLYQKPEIDFNSDEYESKQVFYTSKDGTKIPMIITHKKGLELNGKNPTILYGYGGFNISLTPSFRTANTIWLEQGGIYAVPNLRGGGEYGKKWHDAGTQLKKQNVFDDFIAAAEYLQNQKYTSPDYMAILGRSNGGLLVGATMTQRPDLMKVALPGVGVLDMLRYHTFTAGAGWAYDYGTSEQSQEMFDYLKGYSPVHNVKEGTKYPATMVHTADHDDRVVPAHSFKFISELQDKQAGDLPVLIRIETNAGHGAGKPVAMQISEYVDLFAFTLYHMGFDKLPNAN
jgi:prolyl oligopeptidase